eukprot:gene25794-11467_t
MRSTSRNSATSRISGWTLLTITIFWIAVICSVFPLLVIAIMRSTSRNSATSRISGWTLLTITIFWIAVICSVFPLVVMLHRAETPSVLQRESAFVSTLLNEDGSHSRAPQPTSLHTAEHRQHKSSETNATSEHNEKPQAQPDQNELGSTVGAANKAEVQRIAKPMSQRDQDELGSTVGPADKAEVQQIAKPMLQRDQDELGSTVGPADEAEVQRILSLVNGHGAKPMSQREKDELGSTVGPADEAEVQRIQSLVNGHGAKPMSQREKDELGSTVGPADEAECLVSSYYEKAQAQREKGELGSTVGPADEAEVKRILNFPHVSECKVCKACIPHSAVAHTPKAQQYASKPSIRDILEQGDVFAEFHEKTRAQSNKHSLSSDSSGSGAQLSDGVSSTGSGTRGTARRLLSGDDDDSRFQIEQLDGIFHLRGHDVNLSNIAPGNHMEHHRVDLQDCPICWGCKHTLEFMASGVVQSGSYYSHEVGGSPSWLFRVRTNKTSSGWAVVKTWCVPVMKVKQRGYSPCSPKRTYAQMKILMAQELDSEDCGFGDIVPKLWIKPINGVVPGYAFPHQVSEDYGFGDIVPKLWIKPINGVVPGYAFPHQVSEDCGFGDIVPELWIEPINGVVPGHGFPVNWLGLWADIAEGASIQNLYEGGHPILAPEKFLNLLKSINHEEVKRGAIFDLLFSQCDRHQENLFFTDSGKMTLIDNDQKRRSHVEVVRDVRHEEPSLGH